MVREKIKNDCVGTLLYKLLNYQWVSALEATVADLNPTLLCNHCKYCDHGNPK